MRFLQVPHLFIIQGLGLGLSIAGKMLDLYQFSYGARNVDDGIIFWIRW